jgi:hypothetical protein
MSEALVLTDAQLLRGAEGEPPSQASVCAGPIEALLSPLGDLRRLRSGSVELVRRVFMTVRDEDWLEIPAEISDFRVDARESSFQAAFTVHHDGGGIRLSSEVSITGEESGRITYALDGVAEQAFAYCRIGLCVLHPPDECAGGEVRAGTSTGVVTRTLPQRIGVQGFADGVYLGLFEAFDHLVIQQAPGIDVEFAFEGDLFEMEDQRNWTDASFKTYCTPMYLGYPHAATSGQRFRQRVVISAGSVATADALPPTGPVRIALGRELGGLRPQLGLGAGEHELGEAELALLRPLQPDHVRVVLDASDPSSGDALARAAATASSLAAALEVEALFSDRSEDEMPALGALLARSEVPIARVVVCRAGEETTSAASMRQARAVLGPLLTGVPLFGGTNAYFAEINRTHPDLAVADGVAWTINPQIHASDELSVIETLPIQPETVRSARTLFGPGQLSVSVTLKPPFNNDAADDADEAGDGRSAGLPDNVDARQMSIFAAAWTLGSLKYLLESDVSAISYYETTGWRGLIETTEGSPPAAGFPSFPGMVFPLYHVFADVAELRRGTLLAAGSSDPLRAVALASELDGTVSVVVASLVPEAQQVILARLPGGQARGRHLDVASARVAAAEPLRFRSTWALEETGASASELMLELAPYAVARIDVERSP